MYENNKHPETFKYKKEEKKEKEKRQCYNVIFMHLKNERSHILIKLRRNCPISLYRNTF